MANAYAISPEGNKRLLKQGALPFPAQPWPPQLKDDLARLAETSSKAPVQQPLL